MSFYFPLWQDPAISHLKWLLSKLDDQSYFGDEPCPVGFCEEIEVVGPQRPQRPSWSPRNRDAPSPKLYFLVGAGASIVPGIGLEGSGGLVFPLNSVSEMGAFTSAGFGLGANHSADAFIGFIAGELRGDTLNHNIGLLFLSITVFTSGGQPVGATIGAGPSALPLGYSVSAARTTPLFLYLPRGEVPWPPMAP
jgi:hypothetical protein